MSTLKVGKVAPNFTLTDQNGTAHTLKEKRGGWVLIYFYPKDNTPGCTKQACAIRDEFPKFKRMKCTVYGISVDSEKSHKKFEEKFSLPFTLLADTEKKVVEAYGVWQQKKMMGREYMGTVRTSFLINPEGKIAKIYEEVKPEIHADEVLKDLKAFTKEARKAEVK
jgi:peroxiredoxin Q/BCP